MEVDHVADRVREAIESVVDEDERLEVLQIGQALWELVQQVVTQVQEPAACRLSVLGLRLLRVLYRNFDYLIDVNNRTKVIAILTRGVKLSNQDQSTNLNINLVIFNIFASFIQSSFRFTRLYST